MEGLCQLLGTGLGELIVHGKTFLGTIIHTASALYAAHGADIPCLFGLVHGDGSCGTFDRAESTEHTDIHIIYHMTACALRVLSGLEWIFACCRLGEQIFKYCAVKIYKTQIFLPSF